MRVIYKRARAAAESFNGRAKSRLALQRLTWRARAAYTEAEFKRHIAEIVITKLLREYPQEAKKVLGQL